MASVYPAGWSAAAGVVRVKTPRMKRMRAEERDQPNPSEGTSEAASLEVGALAATSEESVLLARCAQGDQAALAALYDLYGAAAYGLAMQVLHDAAAAQEVVHDAFLKLWTRPALYDPARAAFSTFLLTIVRNAAISRLRGVRYTLPLEDEQGQPLPYADERVNLPQRAEQRAQAERVGAALAVLKPVQRETVERAYYRGESREMIAAAMQVPVGTVKSRLKYALERLRGLLDGEGGGL